MMTIDVTPTSAVSAPHEWRSGDCVRVMHKEYLEYLRGLSPDWILRETVAGSSGTIIGEPFEQSGEIYLSVMFIWHPHPPGNPMPIPARFLQIISKDEALSHASAIDELRIGYANAIEAIHNCIAVIAELRQRIE